MLLECEFDVLPELGPKTPDSTQHEAQTTKSQLTSVWSKVLFRPEGKISREGVQ